MDSIAFGKRMRNKRQELEMTQAELAAKAAVSHQTISQVERGIRNLTLFVAILIADALGVSLDWLCGIDEEPDFLRGEREDD